MDLGKISPAAHILETIALLSEGLTPLVLAPKDPGKVPSVVLDYRNMLINVLSVNITHSHPHDLSKVPVISCNSVTVT